MLAYSVVYTAHYIFDVLYDAAPVWAVFNVISAAGIMVALVLNFAHMRAHSGTGACVLFYANLALAIWFFRNWVDLLALAPGENVSVHSDVVWMLIAVLIPLVLGTTGWRLVWKTE